MCDKRILNKDEFVRKLRQKFSKGRSSFRDQAVQNNFAETLCKISQNESFNRLIDNFFSQSDEGWYNHYNEILIGDMLLRLDSKVQYEPVSYRKPPDFELAYNGSQICIEVKTVGARTRESRLSRASATLQAILEEVSGPYFFSLKDVSTNVAHANKKEIQENVRGLLLSAVDRELYEIKTKKYPHIARIRFYRDEKNRLLKLAMTQDGVYLHDERDAIDNLIKEANRKFDSKKTNFIALCGLSRLYREDLVDLLYGTRKVAVDLKTHETKEFHDTDGRLSNGMYSRTHGIIGRVGNGASFNDECRHWFFPTKNDIKYYEYAQSLFGAFESTV